jgi:hypothetical protein
MFGDIVDVLQRKVEVYESWRAGEVIPLLDDIMLRELRERTVPGSELVTVADYVLKR